MPRGPSSLTISGQDAAGDVRFADGDAVRGERDPRSA
jgi:hypothetical protein